MSGSRRVFLARPGSWRTVRELGLRSASSAASLLLILALARSVSPTDFIASQLAMIAVGLGAVISDVGLALFTTRVIALGTSRSVGRIASTRLILTCAGLAAGAVVLGSTNSQAAAYLLLLGPFLVTQVLRNHVYAQVRAVDGVRFELTVGPVTNSAESLIAATIVALTGSVTLCYSALSLSAIPFTVVVALLARRRASVRVGLGTPSLSILVAAARSGLVPLATGATLKTFGLVLGSSAVAPAVGTSTTAWLLACIRCLDAANAYLTTRIIIDDHARASHGVQTSLRRGLGYVAAVYALCATALPFALVGAPPPPRGWALGLAVSAVALLWFILSKMVHAAHGYRGESPWWAAFGAHAHVAVLPLAAVLTAPFTAVLAFVVPVLAASGTLALLLVKRVATPP